MKNDFNHTVTPGKWSPERHVWQLNSAQVREAVKQYLVNHGITIPEKASFSLWEPDSGLCASSNFKDYRDSTSA
jgi:hypothetical protein